jgi:hypothetical protein
MTDWQTQPTDKAVEQVRTDEELAQKEREQTRRRGNKDPLEQLEASFESARFVIEGLADSDNDMANAALRDITGALELLRRMQNDHEVITKALEHVQLRIEESKL